jgi:hypothetical protein
MNIKLLAINREHFYWVKDTKYMYLVESSKMKAMETADEYVRIQMAYEVIEIEPNKLVKHRFLWGCEK